jgi:hypothetical protein
MKTFDQIYNNIKSAGQADLLDVAPAVIENLLAPNNRLYYSFILMGPAGSGKDYATNTIAETLGWKVVRLESVEGFRAALAERCSIESEQGTVWFINECHKKKILTEYLKEYAEPANGEFPNGGGKENPWVWLPHRNLIVLASNRGCGDVAWVGQGGRAHTVDMLPLTREQKIEALRKCLTDNGMDLPPTKTAWQYMLDYSADYWRSLKMRIERIALTLRSRRLPCTLPNIQQIMRDKEMSKRGFMRHEILALRYLAANPRGLQLKALVSKFQQADDLVRGVLNTLAEYGFATVALAGPSKGLQIPTSKGIAFLKEIDGVKS